MRAKTIERLIYMLALAVAAAPFALPYMGYQGLQKIAPRLSVVFFILALICGAFGSQERRKIEAVGDDTVRQARERTLAKKVGFIAIALALALPSGYLIGRQF